MTTKNDIITTIAETQGLTKKDATATVNTILTTISDSLARGEKVSISGFGVFEARDRAARSGRNPQTGETLEIPATTVPAFRAGTALRAAVK